MEHTPGPLMSYDILPKQNVFGIRPMGSINPTAVVYSEGDVELYAAAPELLEACKEAQKAFKAICGECEENCVEVMLCGVRGAVANINKAVDKAEGR